MAENENGQEKTEEPTGKRIQDARTKGQVPRSQELNMVIMLVGSGSFLLFFGGYLGVGFTDFLTGAFTIERSLLFDPIHLPERFLEHLVQILLLLTPFFIFLTVLSFVGPLALGGFNFSTEVFVPKLSKLNPITGLKNKVFSLNGLMNMVKAFGKFILVASISGSILWGMIDTILRLGEEPITAAIIHAFKLAAWTFLIVSASLIVIAIIDVPFQVWNYKKQLRMTRQEIKDEFKDVEGKPEVKNRIRRLQMEAAQRRMMDAVPQADVVITNPTHFAVALAYKPDQMRAPRLLAKGIDDVAMAIRSVAEEHHITIVTAPQVARAIYYTTELEHEIPGGLFVAVARILAYVYRLRRHDHAAQMPRDLPVPDEYLDPRAARQARRAS
jgi:flagellar biosynthetic protein FlhB